ncbi:MAG: acyl-CoA dehydratase activase, partial [Spirochaetota bacterium]|nr:acyl-CoA dehydratase activase [Spirochaetota bacterium]
FAKTDLIHAQAEGYGLREICDGLCCGLAKNIADTLTSDEAPPAPIIWSGGVSLNRAVQHHLEKILQEELQTDETAASFGAIGAALYGLDRHRNGEFDTHEIDLAKIVIPLRKQKKYYYSPLELTMTDYPDFSSEERYLYPSTLCGTPIEVDIYSALRRGTEDLFLGIDIGSTSTKAVLMDSSGTVRAGFYTRTSGKPMHALRGILEAINDASERYGAGLNIIGAATTGSGRKFIGKVIGADLIVDEITAHAAAAYELNPKIDTIIEIGGQDSKFTTLKNGVVTFSQMNTICAAGTGSFIEEQASKLGVPLSEYSQRAEHPAAPLTSDRCTVFMERDINHYLNRSYSVEEVLAAALFSVRENYLQKVASGASLGKHVCFQGATAKNRALVAAFEQKIGRPIYVSKYCHLTGALGAALLVQREIGGSSTFRGIGLFREEIPVRSETCTLCTNHCRIRIAAVQGEEVAFGFLCGRDYDTKHFVDTNRSGFDLVRAYRRNYALPKRLRSLEFRGAGAAAARRRQEELPDNPPLIGIPAGLHLVENLPFWKYFFTELGFPVITSEDLSDPITRGKPLTGAEFCAPMTAYHGHANYIAGLADILFLPVNLEDETNRGSQEKTMRKYCYYTQYSSGVVAAVQARQSSCSMMLPLIKPNNMTHNVRELHDHLHSAGLDASMVEVLQAYRKARRFFHTRSTRLHGHFIAPGEGEIQVALLGRPYTVLSPAMNKRIPDIFASLGVRTYFQDILPELTSEGRTAEIVKPLLEVLHWKYAARIIEAAAFIAQTPNLYPVYVSSFKCSPDSFTIDYFEELMEAFDKPYLILQLDEHDSSVGYETRIEAGVRAFRNHARTASAAPETGTRQAPSGIDTTFNPRIDKKIEGKTLLFPNWDPLTNPLLAANLRKEGIDARVLEESPELIHQSMQINNGQCLPVSIIAQEAIEYVRRHDLRPADIVLWIAR